MKEGWEYKKLGEVCESKKAILRAKSAYSADDIIQYADISAIDNESKRIGHFTSYKFSEAPSRAQQCVVEKDILYSLVRPNLQNIAILPHLDETNIVASSGFCVLRASSANACFLYYLLMSKAFTDYILGLVSGANYPAVREDDVKNYKFAFPPLSEQQAIVEELDLLNAIIDKKTQELEELDKLAQSIFYDMFGDPMENEKGWEVKKLSELSSKIGDGLHGTPSYVENSGYYFVNGNNLEKGSIVYNKKTKQVSKEEYDKYYIEFGKQTIFVSINGTIGKLAYYRGEQIILGKSACYINLKENVNKVFIYSILSSDYFKKYTMGEKTGSTISNVSLKSIRFFPVPLPPLSLQQQFAARISAIEQMKEKVAASIAEVQTLLAATMDKYFG